MELAPSGYKQLHLQPGSQQQPAPTIWSLITRWLQSGFPAWILSLCIGLSILYQLLKTNGGTSPALTGSGSKDKPERFLVEALRADERSPVLHLIRATHFRVCLFVLALSDMQQDQRAGADK